MRECVVVCVTLACIRVSVGFGGCSDQADEMSLFYGLFDIPFHVKQLIFAGVALSGRVRFGRWDA
jgi:hypothetical protein